MRRQQDAPTWSEPLYPAEELRSLGPVPGAEGGGSVDPRAILARVLDGSQFNEFKVRPVRGCWLPDQAHNGVHAL